MIIVLYFLLASVCLCPSRAVTLSLQSETIQKGTSVTVQWTRDGSDPVAFDLAQYVDLDVLSVTPVTASSASETSGAVSVSFDTPGQVTFGAFDQNQLSLGNMKIPFPHQLSDQQQLTITSGTDGPDTSTTATPAPPANPPLTPTTPTTSTTSTTGTPGVTIITSGPITTGNPDTATDSAQGTQTSPVGGTSSKLSPERSTPPATISFTGSSPTVYSPASASPQSTNTNTNTNTTAGPVTSTGAVSAPQRGMPRAAVIALAVILPLFALVIGILLCYWRVRRHTRHRMINLLLTHVRRSATESASPGPNSGATLPAAGDPEAGAAVLVVVADEKGSLTHLSRPSAPPPPLSPLPPSPSPPPSPPPAYVP